MVEIKIPIGNRNIGEQESVFIVAEIAQAHDGSLGAAHAYIDAVASTGADAIKFQTHIAAAESTPSEPWRVPFSKQDASRYDYWHRMEFSPAQWRGLADHASEAGLVFLSSPFSVPAVDLLENLDVPVWKVAAGEITSCDVLDAMLATGKPLLLSNGMCTWSELDAAVARIRAAGAGFGIFQCTTAYPCPPEQWGLNVLGLLRERYDCPVGLSDHSGTIFAGLGAVALGAAMLEVHVTFSRDCFGPDVPASLTVADLRELVRGVRMLDVALANPVDKDAQADRLAALRKTFGKKVVTAKDLKAGHEILLTDLAYKKSDGGVSASEAALFVGKRLIRDLSVDVALGEGDVV